MPAPVTVERVSELDAMRGIAAALVLLHHAYGMAPDLDTLGNAIVDRAVHTLMHFSPLRIFEFGRGPVLFFFVLSGYVLTRGLLRHGSPGLLAFAAQRSVRLLLPVAASVLLSVGLWFLTYDPSLRSGPLKTHVLGLWAQTPTVTDALAEAALLHTDTDPIVLNPVLWSLAHEWRLTLFLPLVLLVRGQPGLVLAIGSLAAALGIMGGATENAVHLGPHLHSTLPASLYFTFGIASGVALAMVPPLPPRSRWQRLGGLAAAVALFGMGSDLAVYAGSVLLIVLAQQPGRLRQVLRHPALVWLGRVSFSLYLVHAPVLVGWLFLLHGSLPFSAIIGSGFVLVMVATVVMHRLVEVPSQHLARGLERRLRRPPAAGWVADGRVVAAADDGKPFWAAEGGMPNDVRIDPARPGPPRGNRQA